MSQLANTAAGQEAQAIEQLNRRLGELKVKAEMTVTDQTSYTAAGEALSDFDSYFRAVNNHFEPELAPAEETVRRIKLSIAGLVNQAKQWQVALKNRCTEWRAKEKAAAAAEQRKAPKYTTVTASVPSVPGLKNQTFYFAEIPEDKIDEFIRAYDRAQNPERRKFLRDFLTVDEKKISAFARATKDPAKVMEQIPGVRAWSKG